MASSDHPNKSDALVFKYSEDEEDEVGDDEEEDGEYYNEEWESTTEVVIWGEHVPTEERMDEDDVFDGIEELSIPTLHLLCTPFPWTECTLSWACLHLTKTHREQDI